MAKLLVVDDEIEVCSHMAELLEEDKHIVHCAENATVAIEKVKGEDYDCIFLDVLMPKIEGSEALIEIKRIKNVPVIIMSAYLAPDMEKHAMSSGAFTCLKKPFKIKEVQDIISKVVKQGSKS